MPQLKTYDLFISHAWNKDNDYDRLIDMLNAAPNFKYRNYSVSKSDPLDVDNNATKLRDALDRQVRPVNAVLIISGMYVIYRDWIEFEIALAEKYKKPIIGIIPRGGKITPDRVSNAALEMTHWNTDSIVAAIRKHSL